MAAFFDCPYLGGPVELTDEREGHIVTEHPDLLPDHRGRIAETLAQPDAIYPGTRSPNSRRFMRWYDEPRGRSLIVVVVSERDFRNRHWIVTAHISGRALRGEPEWKRS